MKYIDKLVSESIDPSTGRAHLVGVATKTSTQIWKHLVNSQPTTQPIATVFGVAYKDRGADPFNDHAPAVTSVYEKYFDSHEYMLGDRFTSGAWSYEVLEQLLPSMTEPTSPDDIRPQTVIPRNLPELFIQGKIRLIVEAPKTAVQQDSEFKVNRWQSEVGSRLIRLDSSIELVEDLDRQGVSSDSLVNDVISSVIAESINSDIVNTLINIARKGDPINLVNNDTSYYKGRELINRVADMVADIKQRTTAKPSFVLCTPKVEAVLLASGQVTDGVIDGLGVEIVCDTKFTKSIDYCVVGCAGDTALTPSSLYFSPMVVDQKEQELEFLFTRNVENMHPIYGVLTRYALTVGNADVSDGGKVISMDWAALSGKSPYTALSRVIV
ncbi:hypothetical protein [Aeromonas hydrophila]|uniref:hypothetical protein n=1 Tax=Aeromonas hydrophila TaxID=644 RepID=UPI0003A7947F|nr:hypothetical protein [Aeromonas hydrophila]EGX6957503.1 hypothetical protein [Aeromonas hydrophila]MCA4697942.1 hypothetical protein [Aeromonas hydrophila]MCO4221047.1 hypothetical protein [Aeromonas hydrophila]QIO18400.1 hypothetical protein G9455_11345 [Aeromonas hydrophila]USJ78817.1 hypothetical protein LDP97_07175 [Aeromonas hydrophila]